ncbi:PKD domain-containing protein [bacterium]|nr:PKD domain-containing protein [bacterium]
MRYASLRSLVAMTALGLAALSSGCCCLGGLDDNDLVINETPVPPIADIVATPDNGPAPLEVTLNASGSTDSDGEIVQYDWDFEGDGTYDLLDGGVSVTHTYPAEGTFNPKVRVTDDDALSDDDSTTVAVGSLDPPQAVASASAEGLDSTLAHFDGSASSDPDGTIVRFDWDFDNDGTFESQDAGATPDHDYGAFGTFTAGLQVTDNDGLTDTTTCTVTLSESPNVPPVAAVVPIPTSGTATLDVVWDAAGSSDSDGTIVSYDWDMDNDGTFEITDGGTTQNATYALGGIYTVGVRVTDNDGATDTATNSTDVNNPPVAAVSPTPGSGTLPLDVTWDASASTDSDGTIVSYDWDMDNDGTFEISNGGPSQNANYAAGGSFTVGVRVTDDDGATDTATNSVEVNIPPVAALLASPASGNTPLNVTWDALGSSDIDGSITSYDWDMDNDGTFEITNGGPTQPAVYTAGGIQTVGVRVTDDDGATDSTTSTCDVNEPPLASLTPNPGSGAKPLNVTWDASASSDPDGTIVTFDWDMDNDGSFEILDGGSSRNLSYIVIGSITVGVRVTDNDGATAQTTATVDVQGIPPTALLDATAEVFHKNAPIDFDASTSFDTDGVVVQIDWDADDDGVFEIIDGGNLQTIFFTSIGDHDVNIRVTDDDGLTDIGTHTVTLTAVPPFAQLSATDDNNGFAPANVTWDASSSIDDDGVIVQYDYDLDNNGSFEVLNQGPSFLVNYDFSGSYTVGVRVTDDDGLVDTTTQTHILTDIPD